MTDLLFSSARVLWLFAPLLFAACLSAVVLRFDLLAGLRWPIDAGRTLHGRRLLGDSKTWRGVFVATTGCIVAVAIQRALASSTASWSLVDYRSVHPVWFGLAMGGGAMLGELPNSFVKRRLGIPPGKTASGREAVVFYVWDQVDLLTGAWPSLWPWVHPNAGIVATSFVLAMALHPTVSLVGHLVGARTSAR